MNKHRRYTGSVGLSALVLVAATWTSSFEARTQESTSSGGGSILDGVFTSSQASRGQRQFQRACAACHDLRDLTGRKFGGKWQGTTLGDLMDLVSNTMPPPNPGTLKTEEYADILAFFLKQSGYKAGETDLPSDVESLKKILIEVLPG